MIVEGPEGKFALEALAFRDVDARGNQHGLATDLHRLAGHQQGVWLIVYRDYALAESRLTAAEMLQKALGPSCNLLCTRTPYAKRNGAAQAHDFVSDGECRRLVENRQPTFFVLDRNAHRQGTHDGIQKCRTVVIVGHRISHGLPFRPRRGGGVAFLSLTGRLRIFRYRPSLADSS